VAYPGSPCRVRRGAPCRLPIRSPEGDIDTTGRGVEREAVRAVERRVVRSCCRCGAEPNVSRSGVPWVQTGRPRPRPAREGSTLGDRPLDRLREARDHRFTSHPRRDRATGAGSRRRPAAGRRRHHARVPPQRSARQALGDRAPTPDGRPCGAAGKRVPGRPRSQRRRRAARAHPHPRPDEALGGAAGSRRCTGARRGGVHQTAERTTPIRRRTAEHATRGRRTAEHATRGRRADEHATPIRRPYRLNTRRH